MKGLIPTEIRAKDTEELVGMLRDLRRRQFNMRFRKAQGQQEDLNEPRRLRRDVARLLTELGNRRGGAPGGGGQSVAGSPTRATSKKQKAD